MAIRALPASLPLVAAPLDVFDSGDSFRSLLRRLDFLLEGVLTRGTSRDDKGTCDQLIPMGDRGRVRRTGATAGYVFNWLPAECLRRIRRLNLRTQTSLWCPSDWPIHYDGLIHRGEAEAAHEVLKAWVRAERIQAGPQQDAWVKSLFVPFLQPIHRVISVPKGCINHGNL